MTTHKYLISARVVETCPISGEPLPRTYAVLCTDMRKVRKVLTNLLLKTTRDNNPVKVSNVEIYSLFKEDYSAWFKEMARKFPNLSLPA